MPTSSSWVDPEVFLTHNGVTVYHAYRDDDIDQGPMWYHFTLDCNSDDNSFDIRNLDVPLGPRIEPGGGFDQTRIQILKQAIDMGLLVTPED